MLQVGLEILLFAESTTVHVTFQMQIFVISCFLVLMLKAKTSVFSFKPGKHLGFHFPGAWPSVSCCCFCCSVSRNCCPGWNQGISIQGIISYLMPFYRGVSTVLEYLVLYVYLLHFIMVVYLCAASSLGFDQMKSNKLVES
jgi:hypothetical protein